MYGCMYAMCIQIPISGRQQLLTEFFFFMRYARKSPGIRSNLTVLKHADTDGYFGICCIISVAGPSSSPKPNSSGLRYIHTLGSAEMQIVY